jgi:ribosome-binding protein aMBF1 (putative translation factor)
MAGHGAWKKTLKAKRMREGEVTEHPEYAQAVRDLDLGERIREIRTGRGMTQAEVAWRARITQPALSRIELGGGVPTLEMLDRIGRAMGVRFVITLGDENDERVDLLAG